MGPWDCSPCWDSLESATEARSFLAFFAFAVDFEYFFLKSDEMLEEYMNKVGLSGVLLGDDRHGAGFLGLLFYRVEGGKRGAAHGPYIRLGGLRRGLCPVHGVLWLPGEMGAGA